MIGQRLEEFMGRIMQIILKRILKLLFNRIFYVALALLIQMGWLLITAWRLAAYSKYISNAIGIISVLIVLWIVNKKINPSYKLGWTILIMTVPVFGVLLYVLFGKSRIAQDDPGAITHRFRKESLPYMEQDEQTFQDNWKNRARQRRCSPDISISIPVSLSHGNTTAEYFQVGDDMFPGTGT